MTEPVAERPWLNRGSDPVSERVHSLIFNGLTGALTEFMSLSERARISEVIYESLRQGGVEIRLGDGLARLREVADCGDPVTTEPAATGPASPCCDLHNRYCEPPADLCCTRCTEASHPVHRRGEVCVLAKRAGAARD